MIDFWFTLGSTYTYLSAMRLVDLRPLPLSECKVRLAQIAKQAEGWIALTNGVVGEGRALYQAVVSADLEGIVAKKLADPYNPKHTRWHKLLNRDYSQRQGRAEWFRERQGRYPGAGNRPCRPRLSIAAARTLPG